MSFKIFPITAVIILALGCAKSTQDNGVKIGRAQTKSGTPSTTATTTPPAPVIPASESKFGNKLEISVDFKPDALLAHIAGADSIKTTSVKCSEKDCKSSVVLVEVKTEKDHAYCTGFHRGQNQVQFPLSCLEKQTLSDATCSAKIKVYSTDGKSKDFQVANCKKSLGALTSSSTSDKFKDGMSESYAVIEVDRSLAESLPIKRTGLSNLSLKNIVGFFYDDAQKSFVQTATDCLVTLATEYLPASFDQLSLNSVVSGPNCQLKASALGAIVLSDDQKAVEAQLSAQVDKSDLKALIEKSVETKKLPLKIAQKVYTPYLVQSFKCSRLSLVEARSESCDREESAAHSQAEIERIKAELTYRNESLYQMARDWYSSEPNNSFIYSFEFAIADGNTWTFFPKAKCAIPGLFKAGTSTATTTLPYADSVSGVNEFGFVGYLIDTPKMLKITMEFNREKMGGGMNSVYVLKNADSANPLSSKLEGFFNQAKADVIYCDGSDLSVQNEFKMSTSSHDTN